LWSPPRCSACRGEGVSAVPIRQVNPFCIIGEIALMHREWLGTASMRVLRGVDTLEVSKVLLSERDGTRENHSVG
jgi:hypothetical protein